jgi:hypothetical protein
MDATQFKYAFSGIKRLNLRRSQISSSVAERVEAGIEVSLDQAW